MIILGTLEHHRRSLEGVGIVGIRQVAGPKLVADDAGLHNRGVEQISLEHDEAGIRDQWPIEPANDLFILDLGVAAIFADGAPVHGHRIFVDQSRSEEHTSELQSLMRISYAVFCLKKKKTISYQQTRQ